jgi:hypothetical protein
MANYSRHQKYHQHQPPIQRFVCCAGLLAVFAGCGHNQFNVAPVHGRVVIADKPLIKGTLMFAPVAPSDKENPGKPAFGKIQSDGSYRLTTFTKDDGAIIGEHWVTIINIDDELPEGVPEFARLTPPDKVKVVAGQDNQIDIRLSREIAKKYAADNH